MVEPSARLIAYYLPQYHPIPENDAWWGKGFTEWTHVVRAKPLFDGHCQPHLPADLGFYDLRVPETRLAQAELARNHGIEGFMYWHYWFAGRRILERPFNEVLQSGEPDFPLCLGWANASWTGIWYGAANRLLIEQTYPGIKDFQEHFYAVLPAFADHRYIQIDGKPVFFVFRPFELPEPRLFTDCWRELAVKAGLKGVYFMGVLSGGWETWRPEDDGFDAAVVNNLQPAFGEMDRRHNWYLEKAARAFTGKSVGELWRELRSRPRIISYSRAVQLAVPSLREDVQQYPCVMPNWDNTPRSGFRGTVFHNSTPELFGQHLRQVMAQVAQRPWDKRVVIIKSWNEWAEGNYLEPDQQFGRAYLEVVREEVSKTVG